MKVNDWVKALAEKPAAPAVNVVILRKEGHGLNCAAIAKLCKSNVKVLTVDEQWPKHDYTIRWGCTSNLVRKPEVGVINQAKNIHTTFDKGGFRAILGKEGLCPRGFNTPEEWMAAGKPEVVIRPKNHIRGQDFFKEKTVEGIIKAIKACGDGFYMSEVIKVKKEIRVWFFHGRVLWVCYNQRDNDRYEYIGWGEWNMKAVERAHKAFKLSGLDFGAVDVMIDDKGNSFVSEVNTSPEVLGNYQQGCVASAIDYTVQHGAKTIEAKENEGWRGYIHPCRSKEAKV